MILYINIFRDSKIFKSLFQRNIDGQKGNLYPKEKLIKMSDISYDTRKWKDLGFADKMKYSIASVLVFSSIVIGFLSFIWLAMIPTSVIALSGLWLSTALAILGISSYFHNELVQFEGKINDKLKRFDNESTGKENIQ